MKTLIVVALLLAVAFANFHTDAEWSSWKGLHSKKFASEKEESKRFEIFQMNKERAKYYQHLNPEATFGNTKFSDLTPEEFKAIYLNFKHSQMIKATQTYQPGKMKALPDSYDWKDKGAVVDVKDQGQCGSCYIFSTVGNIETVWHNAGHDLVSLSEQQVLDCDKVDDGCGGGWMYNVYDYVVKAGGLESESDYRYSASVGTCKFNKNKVVAKISGYVNVTTGVNHEDVMQQYLYDHAILSVAIDATPFQYYGGGIIKSGCSNKYDDLDHAVLATGWGVSSGTKFWNIKNSWGKSWGEKGYARLLLGKNTCGVSWVPTSSLA